MMRSLWLVCLCAMIYSCSKEVADTVSDSKTQTKVSTSNVKDNSETKPTKHSTEPLKARSELSTETRKNTDKTMEEIKQSSASSSYKVYYQSGQDKHNAGDFTGAIADFTKAIEINPQFADGYGFRGLSKFKSGNKEGACSDWEKAKELDYQHAENLISNYCH